MLVVDLGEGIELSGKPLFYWDIDEDDFAEATKAVVKGKALAIDSNNNHVVDGQSELFGSKNQPGFSKLSSLDTDANGVVDSHDYAWLRLGLAGAAASRKFYYRSFRPLEDFGIYAIKLPEPGKKKGLVVFKKDRLATAQTERDIAEKMIGYDNVNTVHINILKYKYLFSTLPDIRGYGTIPDLHSAMSMDHSGSHSLQAMVTDISNDTLEQLFNPERNLDADFEAILFRYAKADQINPDSRGPHIDARRLTVLERMLDEKFVQVGASNNIHPLYWAASGLRKAYNLLYSHTYADFFVQTNAGKIFSRNGLNRDIIAKLTEISYTTNDLEKRKRMWKSVVRLIHYAVGVDKLNAPDALYLDKNIRASLENRRNLQDLLNELFKDEKNISIINYLPHFLPDRIYKLFHTHLSPASIWVVNGFALTLILGAIGFLGMAIIAPDRLTFIMKKWRARQESNL